MAKKKTTKKKVAAKKTSKKVAGKASKKTSGKTTGKSSPKTSPAKADPNEKYFNKLAEDLARSRSSVSPGAMMSHPGIRYKNKVFAFYYDDRMVFRLGKDFDAPGAGISDFSYLSPFKNKPPMKAWFIIPAKDKRKWGRLANLALEKMIAEIG